MNKELKEILSTISEKKDHTYTKEIEINMKKFYLNHKEYEKNFNKLVDKIGKISKNIVLRELIPFILSYFTKKKLKHEDDLIEYLKEKYPLKKYHIFNNIYHLKWDGKIDLNEYILHDPNINLKNNILSIYKKEKTKITIERNNNFMIETLVEARDYEIACKLAKIKNDEFLNVLAFMLYSSEKLLHNFIITIGYEISYSNSCVFAVTEKTLNKLEKYMIEKNILRDFNFLKDNEILKKLLNLNEQNFLERRIKNSLKWFKEALQEENEVTSFLKMMISLESLLSFQEESFMTPSISHGISENIALILGKTIEERIKLYTQIKSLYSFRSAIAHTGKSKEITYDTKITLSNIIVNLILELICNKKYKDIVNSSSYIEFFRNIKFSNNS